MVIHMKRVSVFLCICALASGAIARIDLWEKNDALKKGSSIPTTETVTGQGNSERSVDYRIAKYKVNKGAKNLIKQKTFQKLAELDLKDASNLKELLLKKESEIPEEILIDFVGLDNEPIVLVVTKASITEQEDGEFVVLDGQVLGQPVSTFAIFVGDEYIYGFVQQKGYFIKIRQDEDGGLSLDANRMGRRKEH